MAVFAFFINWTSHVAKSLEVRHARDMVAHKHKKLVLPVAFFFVIILYLGVLFLWNNRNEDCGQGTHTLNLRGKTFVTIASTPQTQERGLSGHAPLAANEGMLFEFDTQGRRGFWMKEMLFPIDIIWLDADLHVLSFFEDVRPDSYPKTYNSPDTMQYVLEVSAGTVATRGITSGDIATIDSHCKK